MKNKTKKIINNVILITNIILLCISFSINFKSKKKATSNDDIKEIKKTSFIIPNDWRLSFNENNNPIGIKTEKHYATPGKEYDEKGNVTYIIPEGYTLIFDENKNPNTIRVEKEYYPLVKVDYSDDVIYYIPEGYIIKNDSNNNVYIEKDDYILKR